MARKAIRARIAPWLERLEERSLLSSGFGGTSSNLVLVGFANNTVDRSAVLALRAVRGQVVESYPGGPSVVQLPVGEDPIGAVQSLSTTSSIRYAEADQTVHADFIPNDPQFYRQWGLSNPNGVDVNAPAAWNITVGSPNIVVAVIDSGIDINNAEFAGRIWTNPAGSDRSNPGDLHGWNFLNNSPNVQDTDGHGTHVSGIIAANGNNGIGVTGVAFGVKIMPLKFIGADGSGSIDNAVAAIYFAVNHGAKVINASWGGNEYSQTLTDAINYADAHGVVFVTAAGNESVNNDVVASYPADNRSPNAISVAAIDENGNLASFSNYGPATVDIAAPGVDIRSTVPGGYATYSGTSMATPFVAGVVALVASAHPSYNAEQLVHQVLGTTKPLPALAGRVVTGGMVDAYRALTLSPAAESTFGSAAAAGVTSDDVHATILASDEFYTLQGGTPQGFVDGVYRSVLGRAADPTGISVWVGQLNAGASRGSVALAIIQSDEGRRAQIAQWFNSDLNRGARLSVLEASPAVANWAADVENGLTTMDDVRATILASDEFYADHGANPNSYVDGLYRLVLGRPADPNGYAVWVGELRSGMSRGDVAFKILTSPEARETQIAQWFVSDLQRNATIADLKSVPTVVGWANLTSS
jgi:subtilisin family serine protease